MSDVPDIRDLIFKVEKLKPGAPLDKFIGEAVFSNFKSLAPGARIVFEFPLTAIVGPNGSGKSTILHALWGMPLRSSTSRFWFSTALDPIQEGGQLGPPRYHYAHYVKQLKRFVQTRKQRVSKKKGYWEPARLSVREGMEQMPELTRENAPFRSTDRWNAPSRKVLYMNFKCEFSSFDRFFYYPARGQTLLRRQNAFLQGAKKLKRVIDSGLQSYSPGGKQAVFENRDLSKDELGWISYILGRQYTAARFAQHRLYGNFESPSVVFTRYHTTYSEAFAGSGELAIALAVMRLMSAENETLVLLDEPETSLHPGAQKRLVNFLLKMILEKQLQIVMSTHSPTMVEDLPTKAIAVLEELENGKTIVISPSHPQVAFNRLGSRSKSRFTVAVEDALLMALVEIAMNSLDPGERDAFELYVPPGGASAILRFEINHWLAANRQVYVILDGDQKPRSFIPDPATLGRDDLEKLCSTIKEAFGVQPLHMSDGDVDTAVKYINWINQRLRFLNAICPERVLLEGLIGKEEANIKAQTNQDAKRHLIQELSSRGHRTDAASLAASASFILRDQNPAYSHIIHLTELLKEFLKHDVAEGQAR